MLLVQQLMFGFESVWRGNVEIMSWSSAGVTMQLCATSWVHLDMLPMLGGPTLGGFPSRSMQVGPNGCIRLQILAELADWQVFSLGLMSGCVACGVVCECRHRLHVRVCSNFENINRCSKSSK